MSNRFQGLKRADIKFQKIAKSFEYYIMNEGYNYMEWTDERVKRFWDYESKFPENYFTFQVGEAVINDLKKYFPNAKSVLDFGAGPGFLVSHLLKAGLKVTALEFSDDSIDQLNKRFGNSENFNGVHHAEFLLETKMKFDVIMAVEVIEHLNDYYLDSTLQLIKKLLAPEGVVIFTTPNDEDLSKSMIYSPATNEVFHRWQHVRSWSRSSLGDSLERYGYKVIEILETRFENPKTVRSHSTGAWRNSIKSLLRQVGLMKPPIQLKVNMPHLVAVAGLK